MIQKFFNWLFKSQIEQLNEKIKQVEKDKNSLENLKLRLEHLLGSLDISVDIHHHGPSWAVISLQGQTSDFIKFIDLSDRDIHEISRFLRNFEGRHTVDANPSAKSFLRSTMKFDRR